MYKDKPLVIKRPWWRHHWFPWGWYSLNKIEIPQNKFSALVNTDEWVHQSSTVTVDGNVAPGDGGGGIYRFNSDYKIDWETPPK